MDKKNTFLSTVLIMLLTVLFLMETDEQVSASFYENASPYAIIEGQPYIQKETEPALSDDDAALIALIAMAEAEGESEDGKRLVIDVVFNRTEHPDFPNTIYDVVYQPRQFSPVWNGRMNRCYVQEDILQLVYEEFANRTNDDVIFFNADKFSKYGSPLFQVGNHYFSSY